MGKLKDVELRNWIKAGKPVVKTDGDGLTFTLSANGTAAWVLRYRVAGRQREVSLGRYPDLSLAKAREEAAVKRVEIRRGVDVAQEKQQQKDAAKLAAVMAKNGTVKALYEDFFARQIKGRWKNDKQVSAIFELHVLPTMGDKQVTEVRPADIDAVLRRLSDRGVFRTAAKTLQLVKRLFDHAMTRHLIAANPAAPFGWRDIGGKSGPRSRVLSRAELVTLFKAMWETPNFPPHAVAALKLLLALAVRKGELLKATWDEFDLDQAVWHLPAERTKTVAAIRIPLAPWAIEVLEEQRARKQNAYVFPVLRRGPGKTTGYIGETTINEALYRLHSDLAPFTVHDLQRTARTHLAALGVAPHIAELCLNHKLKGITAVYDVHDYFEERRAALEAWASLLNECEKGRTDNVIPIRGAV